MGVPFDLCSPCRTVCVTRLLTLAKLKHTREEKAAAKGASSYDKQGVQQG